MLRGLRGPGITINENLMCQTLSILRGHKIKKHHRRVRGTLAQIEASKVAKGSNKSVHDEPHRISWENG